MDFAMSDEQIAIFDMASDFGGLFVSEEDGGTGISSRDARLVFEAQAMARDLKSRSLAPASKMKTVPSYCVTDPAARSDAAPLKTLATTSDDGLSLSAIKNLQLHRGYGYLADYGIEKVLRAVRIQRTFGATDKIMRLVTPAICCNHE